MEHEPRGGGPIVSLHVYWVAVPLVRPFVTAVRRTDSVTMTIVKVMDADGHSGWGEAATNWKVTGESPQSVSAAINGPLSEAVIGYDPEDETLDERIRQSVYGNAAARSAVDGAIHDLVAVVHRVGLAASLGASSTNVRTDMSMSAGDPAALAHLARQHVEAGFDHLKLKIDRDHDGLAGIRAVRGEVGPDVCLRLDANQAWTSNEAIAFICQCEDDGLNLEFVEQPVAAGDIDGMARVVQATQTPIVADESVRTPGDVAMIAQRHGATGVNIKLAKTGGVAEALRAAEEARNHGLDVMVGCMMEGPIGVGTAACLAAVVAPDTVHDLDAPLWLRHSPVIGGPLFIDDRIELPQTGGLGIKGLEEIDQ